VQRRVNEVYEGSRGLVLTAGESYNTGFVQTPTPELYFNEIRFLGIAAADSLGPQLRITYTWIGALGEDSP